MEGWDVNGRIMQIGILVDEKQNCITKQVVIHSVMPFQICVLINCSYKVDDN